MHGEFTLLADLGLIFAVAVAFALLLARLGLPAVLAYLGTGLVLGPSVLGLVEKSPAIDVLAEVGAVLLLFTVGLEFSLGEIRRSWRAVLLAGGFQVGGTLALTATGAVLARIAWPSAVTWGFLVSLSSTAVVLRLLDARGETKGAHGRLVLGVLIFQDLCVVPMMLLLPQLAGGGGGGTGLAVVLAKAAAIVVAIVGLSRLVVPRLMTAVAATRNREVFLLAVLAIAGITAYTTSLIGLSLALGAFLAGMVLADTQYAHQALADVVPLRSVMLCVFFVAIGLLIDLDTVARHPALTAALFAAILAVKFTAMAVAGLVLRFPVRIAALAGVSLAQVGEFSFVLASAATREGLITDEQQRLFLAASVLTIAVAPLAVALFPRLLAGTQVLRPLERILDGAAAPPVVWENEELDGHVIVAGYGVGGRAVVDALEHAGLVPLVVETNPETVLAERAVGRHVVYGDITSPEVLEHAGIHHARALVLVISDVEASRRAAHQVVAMRKDLPIVLRTRFQRDEADDPHEGIEVLSEEFAGAVAIAGLALRHAGVADWAERVGNLVAAREGRPSLSADVATIERARPIAAARLVPTPPPPVGSPAWRTRLGPEPTSVQRWSVAVLTAVVAAACVGSTSAAFSLPAFGGFVVAVVVSTVYGGLATGAFTAVAAWVFSNVFFVAPVGELSFHREALLLLLAYVVAAMIGGIMRVGPRDREAT